MEDRIDKEEIQLKKKPQLAKEKEIIQMIVFNLGDEEFGADINQVREIILRGIITPIPDSPEFICGVSNVRGEITVVIDLKTRFSLPIRKNVEGRHIVITEQEKNLFGLMVDEVTEVLRIPEKDIKPTPELVTRIDRIYIRGVITLEDRLILLIDLAKVLFEEELARLATMTHVQRKAEKAKRLEENEGEVPETQKKKAPVKSQGRKKSSVRK